MKIINWKLLPDFHWGVTRLKDNEIEKWAERWGYKKKSTCRSYEKPNSCSSPLKNANGGFAIRGVSGPNQSTSTPCNQVGHSWPPLVGDVGSLARRSPAPCRGNRTFPLVTGLACKDFFLLPSSFPFFCLFFEIKSYRKNQAQDRNSTQPGFGELRPWRLDMVWCDL